MSSLKLIIATFFSLSFYISLGSSSRQEVDQENQKAIHLLSTNLDSAFLVASQIKVTAQKSDYPFGLGESNYLLAYIEHIQGKLDKAAILYFESLRYLESDNSNRSIYYKIASYSNIGKIFHEHHQFENAIQYFEEGLSIANGYDKDGESSNLYYLTARSQKFNGQFLEAVNSLFEASKLAQRLDDHKKLLKINHQLGLIFFELGDYQKSLDHHFRIFEYQDIVSDFPFYGGRGCHNIAEVYKAMDNLAKAEDYYIKALNYKNESQKPAKSFVTYMDLGELYLSQEKLKAAKETYDKALKLGLDVSPDPDKFKIYKQLSTLYGHLGNPEKFTEYNTKYTECLEKHLKTSEELAQMDQQYNIQLVTQRYFELVESQKRMAALKKYGGFAVAAILSIILLYLIIARVRKTRLKKSLEQELKEAMQGLDFDL